MIKHIVMFQFKDENKKENLLHVKEKLEALVDLIGPLKSMEVGINFTQSERAMDLVLTSVFEDKAGLKEYATHPEHLKVVELIKSVTLASKVVDYEQ